MTTFDLYLIRHGLAGQGIDAPEDVQRPLTEEGQRKTRKIADRLRDLGLKFDLMLTSPLVRAHQTAEILRDAGLAKDLQVSVALAAEGAIQTWLEWLETWAAADRSLALVGHEPHLSTWAEQLVWGQAQGKLELKKAGAIGLHLPAENPGLGQGQLFWLTPPRLLL